MIQRQIRGNAKERLQPVGDARDDGEGMGRNHGGLLHGGPLPQAEEPGRTREHWVGRTWVEATPRFPGGLDACPKWCRLLQRRQRLLGFGYGFCVTAGIV